jgi:hypothetical protein
MENRKDNAIKLKASARNGNRGILENGRRHIRFP